MKKLLTFALTLTLSSLLLLSPLAQADNIFGNKTFSFLKNEPKLMPVDEAFSIDFKQTDNVIKVSWVIADGYYMYRDKLKFAANGATLGQINLPQGVDHTDDYFGTQKVYHAFVEVPVAIKQAAEGATLNVTFMGCAEGKLCFPPTTHSFKLAKVDSNAGVLPQAETDTPAQSVPVSQQDSLSNMLSSGNLLWTLVIFFGLGIGLALTPCVFPMYPILSGIIVGHGKKLSTVKAFTLSMAYVQGMAITYSILGLIVASAGMKYQAALQAPAVLIGLAILFVVLSLSMFGVYELRLPAKWQEKMTGISNNQKSGNLVGVFLMGALSGLVASPCTTAPLSGALIYVAQTGDLLQGFLALYILSLGMGLPLLVIGTSGGKLLPKAGAWMDIIKTIFGFLLIAVSITMIARIWPHLISDLLWSAWGIAFTGYLMHQNKLSAFNWKQTARAVVLLLLLLSSFSYGLNAIMGKFYGQSPLTTPPAESLAHSEFIKIKSLDDLQAEVAKAKAQGKPVMVDFYADWCVACKEFDEITFPDAAVVTRTDKMVLLRADVTKNDPIDIALLEHYGVLGLPTLLMFDQQGQIRDDLRVTGFMKPGAFANHLDHLLNK